MKDEIQRHLSALLASISATESLKFKAIQLKNRQIKSMEAKNTEKALTFFQELGEN